MKCPTDETTLVMSERSGIEIDYCPTCRGVWLDRGELDKIIERSLVQQPVAAPAQTPPPPAAAPSYERYEREDRDRDRDRDRDDRRYQPQQQGYYKKKRKESWLSEIFD
ncbi:zf-TFIIB domain-containing protein [Nocardioides sp. W7]|uniref:TFIIB-type zinc ribbon-containing protein n=1 Tax=Nocardioides sp. W7 TaxID=2931390 RepID=UPI001FD4A21A|nr:zf-TFIIB domain-containing protein [Nocardioides sp. W7]